MRRTAQGCAPSDDAPLTIAALARVPPRIGEVIVRTLARDPDARFPTMDAVARALEVAHYRTQRDAQAAPATVGKPVPPTRRASQTA